MIGARLKKQREQERAAEEGAAFFFFMKAAGYSLTLASVLCIYAHSLKEEGNDAEK